VDSEVYATRVTEEHSYRYFCAEQVPKYEEHVKLLPALTTVQVQRGLLSLSLKLLLPSGLSVPAS